MVDSLQRLGFQVAVARRTARNRATGRWLVRGLGGKIPNAGTPDRPLELFVGNAGTAARFLAALVCLGRGVYRLQGTPRMQRTAPSGLVRRAAPIGLPGGFAEQPAAGGYFRNGAAPGAACTVGKEESSQFASALLFARGRGRWKVGWPAKDSEQEPYVAMTPSS